MATVRKSRSRSSVATAPRPRRRRTTPSTPQNAQTLAAKILDPSAPPAVRPVTHVAFLLDKSGSMSQHRTGAVQAINGLIATTKESAKDQDILVSFYQFGS